jgi:hypothetical protein
MRRTLVLLLASLVGVCSAGVAAAQDGETIQLGRGIGLWRIGQDLVVRPGLLRSVRYRKNDGPGCTLGPETASRIDFYEGLRLSWSGVGVPWIKRPFLSDVATTRIGDRSGNGFVIGRSTLRAVRATHFRAQLRRPRGRFALGRTSLTLSRRTGYESWKYFTYWFDRAGRLRALQTGAGGC